MRLVQFEHHASTVILALAVLLVAAFILIGVLMVQLQGVRDDVARVESGAAFAGIQIEAIRQELTELEPALSEGLDDAIVALEAFGSGPLEFDLHVDQAFDIDTEVPIRRDLVLPIDLTVPIDESLRTTIGVEGPLGVEIPVNVTVPIRIDVPVSTEILLSLDEIVPIQATVPARIEGPVRLDLADTDLATAIGSLVEVLRLLQSTLADLR